jgi:K+-sensing histidine kinase KdpD
VDFAHLNRITQIFIARSQERFSVPLWPRGLVHRIVRLARDMQVVIVSDREPVKD